MRIEEFKNTVRKVEPLLKDNTISIASYRLFILKELPAEHANEEKLFDIFTESSIALLIEQGEEIINTGFGESLIMGGESVDFSDYRDRYLEIFSIWQKRDWVEITEQPNGKIKIKLT